ncbi:cellulose biosynthesis protein BcsC [uncultured Reyranella sp.]|uniref:cellulose biosynthesis protein BcsC n=1 Tax=uncultured Reyranella sp. TaxID=735512 RepID=UPI0025E01FCF|nr:cellulose biosynthesis protein BcsC [uncultured Reyranella sp.]
MGRTERSERSGTITSVLASAAVALFVPNPGFAAPPTTAADSSSSSIYGLLFEQATMWRERNRPDLAAQSLRKILESQPDNTEALFQLGSIELQNQRFDQVRATIARLRQIDPNDARAAELERAMALGQTDEVALAEARRLAAAGAYDRAIAMYQRAFRGGPPPFDLAVEYYETLAGTGAGWDEARIRLKALAERSYATSRTKFAYARILTYNEQTRREGIVLLAELASDPAVAQASFEAMRQGMLWLTVGPQDKPFFESYLQRFPGDTVVRDKLIDAQRPVRQDPLGAALAEAYRLSDQGLNDQAVSRFEGVLQADPSNADAVAGIGIARLRQERFADARDQLDKAIKMAPSRAADWAPALEAANFWLSYREAVALRDRGDLTQAEKIVRPLADHTGTPKERGTAQALMGDLLRRQGKQREAEGYYRDALSRDPGNKEAQAGLYQVLTAQGRDTRSEPLLANLDPSVRTRVQSDGAQQAAQRLRTQAAGLERSQPERAEQLYREAIRMDPSSPWTRYDLAKFLARQGKVAEAQPLIDELVASGRPESIYAAAVYYSEQSRTGEAVALLDRIPVNQRSARMNTLRNDLRNAGDTDQLIAAAKAGDAGARATLAARANAPNATPSQQANAALALAKVGDRAQAMAVVRRLAARKDLSADTLRTMFYAASEAGQDAEASTLLARISKNTGGRDVASLQESLAIQQSDRLRTQKNLTAAYDVLLPYVSGPSPSVGARLALARVYKDSNFSEQAIQVLDGIMVSAPADADTLQQAVNIAIDLRRYERADVWLAEALRLQPQNPRLYMVQARLLRAQGDTTGAKRALETAQQLNRGLGQTELVPAPAPSSIGVAPVQRAAVVSPGSTGAEAPERSSLRPPSGSADAEFMAEFERRVAAKKASVTSKDGAPGPADVMSLDRPSLATPAILTAQAGPVRAAPPVQVAQNPLVPLRRPGGESSASTSVTAMTPPPLPGTPGAPSGSMSDTDPLSREIERELTSLKKSTAIIVDGGIGFRGRSGESGLGRINEITVPIKARIPIGNAALVPTIMPVTINAGTIGGDPSTLSRYGANALAGLAGTLQPNNAQATGIAFGMGLEWGRLTLDVGSTPLGFPLTTIVGGLVWNQPLGDKMNIKLEASRRSVTDSVLSYAGVTDPITGLTWGGVTRNGGEAIISYDDQTLGIYGKFAYGYYMGTNVASNQSYEFTAGAYFRPIKDENQELKVGISATYLSFNQNLSYFTYGQGGYFSPQSFYSLTFPIDWTETSGKFTYSAGATLGVQSIQQSSSLFFPTNYYFQNAANILAASGAAAFAPVFPAQSNTGIAFGLRLGFEYAATERTSIGAKANFDNAYQYDQGTILLFLKSAFN